MDKYGRERGGKKLRGKGIGGGGEGRRRLSLPLFTRMRYIRYCQRYGLLSQAPTFRAAPPPVEGKGEGEETKKGGRGDREGGRGRER